MQFIFFFNHLHACYFLFFGGFLDRPCCTCSFLRLQESSTSNSIAWAEFACIDGKIGHPFSHCCPAKDLSINMIVAFVQEYHAAGPWRVVDDNIDFDYYGTLHGFKCVKLVPWQEVHQGSHFELARARQKSARKLERCSILFGMSVTKKFVLRRSFSLCHLCHLCHMSRLRHGPMLGRVPRSLPRPVRAKEEATESRSDEMRTKFDESTDIVTSPVKYVRVMLSFVYKQGAKTR